MHDISDVTTEVPIETTLSDLRNPEFFNHAIMVDALVIGKDVDPFIVPSRVRVQCNNPGSRKGCKLCPILGEAIEIDFTATDLIKFTGITEKALEAVIIEAAFLPKCDNVEITKQNLISTYRVQLQTPIVSSAQESKPTTAKGYVLTHEVEANKIYSCVGLLTSDTKNQYATIVIN